MRFLGLLLLLTSTLAVCQQGAKPAPKASGSQTTPPAASSSPNFGPAGSNKDSAAPAFEVPPNAAVITVTGICDLKSAGTASSDCKTTVTRAEFERLADALKPNLPPAAKQKLGEDYTRALVFSAEAKKRGLDQGTRLEEVMRFIRMQVVAQELLKELQEQAKPTPEQVAQYYKDHESQYQEVTLKRIFLPKNRSDAKPDDKPDEAAFSANAEKIRARAAAGEDFDKLQKEVFEAAGFKTPPPTTIPAWRRQSVPASQAAVFDLKPGEVSQVLPETIGAYIYRLESKRTLPLDQVKPEIEANLSQEKFTAEMQSLTSGVKTELNEAYFHIPQQHPPAEGSVSQPSASKAASTGPTAAKPAAPKEPATQSK
ncbi:MAG TPA: peptidyl-prolyl cis-trans isomerase [Terriglobales bacterium]|nr:peptidyl-prolyl cis-trans isomerase [Terriglobales bacterium]